MLNTNVMDNVSSAIPSCSGFNRVGVVVENFFNRRRINAMEPPNIVGSTSNATVGPIARSPTTYSEDNSSHSGVSSFGGHQMKKKYYCKDCRKEADDVCEDNHVIQRLNKAREQLAADELTGLEILLERRISDLQALNHLNVEAAQSIFENHDVYKMLDKDVREAHAYLKDSIVSECDAERWEEARQRAQMLLARERSTLDQGLKEFQKESISLFLRTTGGNAWLGNNVRVAQHPLLLFAIIQMLYEGTLTDARNHQVEENHEGFEAKEHSIAIEECWTVKEDIDMKPINPSILQRCESILLQPCGGRGQRLGRNGRHHPLKPRTQLNSVFRPALSGVGRRAGTRKIEGLVYDLTVKEPTEFLAHALDLSWLMRREERRKKEAILRSRNPIRTLTGVYCHKDPSFVTAMLRKHKDHLEKLVLYAVRREHLQIALEMPMLRKLDVWTSDNKPIRYTYSLSHVRVQAKRLQWMELNLRRVLVGSLLRAVGDSLQELLLWVGTGSDPSLPSNRDKWPSCCSTLDRFLLQCGPLPKLRSLALMRNKAWCHSSRACSDQLASVRHALPHVSVVRCDVCDVIREGGSSSSSQGTFSQGSFDFQNMEDDVSGGEGEDSDSSRPEPFDQ